MKKPAIIIGISFLLVAAAISANALSSHTSNNHAVLPARPIPPHGTGIAASLADLPQAVLDHRLEEIRASGATWVRSDLSWNVVQNSGPTSYKWQVYDRVVEASNAHGLQTLFIIDFTPSWARPSTCTNSEMCGPASADIYAQFAEAAAKHFTPLGVHSWEIWNEPNISFRYHPATNPAQYTKLLKGSYEAIKGVDASADIIAAGTAPSASDYENLSPVDFLNSLYDNGAHGYFTAISSHPYTYPKTPATSGPLDAWGQLPAMHDIMASHGDGDKQIWLTEFGAPTNGPANRPNEYVTEALQAKILTEAIDEIKAHKWFGPFFWYDYKDSSSNPYSSENFFGLVRADGTRKPAYDAFKRAAAEL